MDWPQRAKTVQLTVKNASIIRKGFKEAFDSEAIAKSWESTHPNLDSMTPQMSRDWGLAHINVKQKPLQLAMTRTYSNAYALGESIARARVLGMVTKSVNVVVNTVDWANWTPGMNGAAALLKPKKGLQMLLDREKITVSSDIAATKIDRIGTILYQALEKGYGPKETAKMIDVVIDDPQHALLIARTETSRALNVAARDQYEKSNIQLVEWLVAEPCDECQENADASPIAIDDTFPSGDSEPPAHPNCVCALAPAFDDSELPPADNANGGNFPEDN